MLAAWPSGLRIDVAACVGGELFDANDMRAENTLCVDIDLAVIPAKRRGQTARGVGIAVELDGEGVHAHTLVKPHASPVA
jgi:hypothetical protein